MPLDRDTYETALNRTLGAIEWMSRGSAAMAEPNGSAAAQAFFEHARRRLLEAAELLETRPASLLAQMRPKARAQ